MNAQNISQEMSSADFVLWIKEDLGLDLDKNSTNHDSFIIRSIFQANILMGVPIAYETQQAVLPIADCQVKKPCDYIKLIKLTVGECCDVPNYEEPTKLKCDNRCIDKGRTYNYGNHQVVENNHYFSFGGNSDGCDLNITYLSYNFDENGYPMVDLTYSEAITAYTRWKNIIRMRGAGMGARAGFTAGDEREAMRLWGIFAGINRARKRMDALNEDMLNQIMARWSDPYYIPTNPYLRNIIHQNTIHNHT